MLLAQLGDLLEGRRQPRQLAAAAKALHCSQLLVCCTTGPNEVRVVRVRQAVRARPRRGHYRALLEEEHGLVRAREREDVRDRLQPFGVRDRMATAVENAESNPFARRELREEAGAAGA